MVWKWTAVLKLTLVLVCSSAIVANASSKPNIVIILADDLGWNDVSFHGSNQIPTPNIDALAYNGIILNSHYVPALCTPSRASLLTGKYPTSVGMQHMVILAHEPWGLPLEENLLPQHLRRHGYSTHAVGKWHLGFHKKSYTPNYRGFDTFFGYYNGYQDYYDHTMEASDGQDAPSKGLDMRRNLDIDYDSVGKYSTDAFTDEAVKIIHNHDDSQGPMFLYLAHLAPHTGNSDKPYQAPDAEIAKFAHIQDPERRVYAAMVSKLDDSVGQVMTALRSSGKLDDTIVLFLSDNGAVTFGVHSNHGSNYPLRGLKESPWEGGVRGVAAVWSSKLNRTRRVSNQMMHVADWLPTLYSAAGLDTSELGDIDGKDLWSALSHDLESPRNEVFNNYDEVENYSSLRMGPWKYVSGTAQDGEVDSWYGDSGEDDSLPPYDVSAVLQSETSVAIGGLLTERQLQDYSYSGRNIRNLLSANEARHLRLGSTISCSADRRGPLAIENKNSIQRLNNSDLNSPSQGNQEMERTLRRIRQQAVADEDLDTFGCDPRKNPCLFNLEQDPCEEVNLARVFPTLLAKMEERLRALKNNVVRPLNQPADPLANPALYNGTWVSWCDPENVPVEDASFLSWERTVFTLVVDNIIVKLLTFPLLGLLTVISQSLFGFLQSLISLATAIVLFATLLFVLDTTKRLFDTCLPPIGSKSL